MEIKDLQETAALARLDMSENELQALLPAFEQMLSLLDTMQTAGEEITAAAYGNAANAGDMIASARIVTSDYFRTDTEKTQDEDLTENILANAGERDGRFVVIPNVL
ncbi:MAG: aspartyl/glutamyl-tRNA amidotransferase subunit C [Treponema sp.]|jgi:aspartyl-tRNA(Asn)/glutamyl-tRNA(Gln) amidotransferase subunit C|nr:aspartyl/glutamyl-tRNA amidotransferase subunit C [Treponema sp.]